MEKIRREENDKVKIDIEDLIRNYYKKKAKKPRKKGNNENKQIDKERER